MRNLPRFEEFVALAADQIDADGRQWIEVMPLAEKAKNGPWYFTITAEDLETYAQWIRAHGGKIPIDYDHAGSEGGSSRAAGWFTGEADVRDTEQGPRLYAQAEWTPKAQQEIRDGEFRFISPEFNFHAKDPKSGLLTRAKEIAAATLTNRPFFRELAPVTGELLESEELDALGEQYGEDVAALVLAALGGDIEQVRGAVWSTAFINDLPDSSFLHVEAGGEKDGEGKTTPRSLRHFPVKDASGSVDMPHLRNALSRIPQSSLSAEVKQQCTAKAQRMMGNQGGPAASAANEGDEMPTDYLKALGLDESSDDAKKVAAALNQKDEQILGLQAEITDLKAEGEKSVKLTDRITELEARDRQRDVEILLAKGVDSGRILPAEKDTLTELFADNVSGLKTLLASRPAGFYAAYGRKEKGSGGGATTFDDPDTAAVAREFGATGDEPIDEESAQLHLRAMAMLKEQGKERGYSAEEYSSALKEASTKVGAF